MRAAVNVGIAVHFAFACLGCEPAAGRSCGEGDVYCVDRSRQLVCEDGVFIETPCRGPGGCAIHPDGVRCDVAKNRAGDRCSKDDEGASACAAEHRMLVCRGGAYVDVPCRGPDGCITAGSRTSCDTAVARAGDACSGNAQACDDAGKRVLVCRDRKMEPSFHCRGPDGCAVQGGPLSCDVSIARVGDPCDERMQGQHACADDQSGLVTCKDGKFQLTEACPKGKSCTSEGSLVGCHENEGAKQP
ncbi:MAG TPA: hypothetical protein VF989_16195 [Polyangiaceae bacterium]